MHRSSDLSVSVDMRASELGNLRSFETMATQLCHWMIPSMSLNPFLAAQEK